MKINGFMIVAKIGEKDCFYTGSKMGAGFGGIYGGKIYKSAKKAQEAIDTHSGPFWENAQVIPATLEVKNE